MFLRQACAVIPRAYQRTGNPKRDSCALIQGLEPGGRRRKSSSNKCKKRLEAALPLYPANRTLQHVSHNWCSHHVISLAIFRERPQLVTRGAWRHWTSKKRSLCSFLWTVSREAAFQVLPFKHLRREARSAVQSPQRQVCSPLRDDPDMTSAGELTHSEDGAASF